MAERVKVSCFHCGTTNYYPLGLFGKKVVCGRCRNVLPKPGTVIEPTPEQANNLFRNSSLSILIDFHSPACAPCYVMHSVVESLARRRAGELMAIKVNVDHYPQLGAAFGVKAVPTFVIIHRGNEIARISGAMSETDFALWVASKI